MTTLPSFRTFGSLGRTYQFNATRSSILFYTLFLKKDFGCFISVFLLSLKMRFFAILALSAKFMLPIFADDDDLAIPPGDIPTTCQVTCAAVVQQANTCQALAAAAAPADDDKRRWFGRFKLENDHDAPTTADPCICKNATSAVNTIAPPYDTCVQANGATTTGKPLPSSPSDYDSDVQK
jgi:hypothetical protein